MKAALRADDRVLFLAMPSHAALATVARILMQGVIVALGTPGEVDDARRALAEFDNIMMVEADPTKIPWRDSYFTKIFVPPALASLEPVAAKEWSRILAPGGEIVIDANTA